MSITVAQLGGGDRGKRFDRSIGNMLRFDNLKPSNGEVIIRGFTPSGQGVGPGVNGIQVLLNTDNVDSLPSITANPESTNGVVGGGLELNVGVSGDNLQIQWYRNGQDRWSHQCCFIIGELTAEDAEPTLLASAMVLVA